MTTHESKLELKQLRYPENCAGCVSLIFKAITFYLTIGFSSYLAFQKLDIQHFLETSRSSQFEFGKAFKKASKVSGPTRAARHFLTYKVAKTSFFKLDLKWEHFWAVLEQFLGSFISLLSTFLSQKHIKKPLIPPSSQQTKGSVLTLNLSLLGPMPWT